MTLFCNLFIEQPSHKQSSFITGFLSIALAKGKRLGDNWICTRCMFRLQIPCTTHDEKRATISYNYKQTLTNILLLLWHRWWNQKHAATTKSTAGPTCSTDLWQRICMSTNLLPNYARQVDTTKWPVTVTKILTPQSQYWIHKRNKLLVITTISLLSSPI